MLGLISAALGLATSVFSFLGQQANMTHINNVADLENQFNAEVAKGVGAMDDGLLETIYANLQIELEAARSQLALASASKPIV